MTYRDPADWPPPPPPPPPRPRPPVPPEPIADPSSWWSSLLEKCAGLHRRQSDWNRWWRVGWWFFLLPVAMWCWAAGIDSAGVRRAGLAAAAVVGVVYISAGASDPQSQQVAATGETSTTPIITSEADDEDSEQGTVAPSTTATTAEDRTTPPPNRGPQPGADPAAEVTVIAAAAVEEPSSLLEQLAALVGRPDADRPRYNRDAFDEGQDLDGDCVRTRHEVLFEEGLDTTLDGCKVVAGTWFDPFTGLTFTNPQDLEVDHVVSLDDAWDSGAWTFTPEQLTAFGNQMGNLNAIEADENQRKANLGPANYVPANTEFLCNYLVQYASVKIAWGLTITPEDYAAVEQGLATCDPVDPDEYAVQALTAATAAPPPPTSAAPVTTRAPTTQRTTTLPATTATGQGCHPAYVECLPNLPGDALNCGDIDNSLKPIHLKDPAIDPYNIDGRGHTVDDGLACE